MSDYKQEAINFLVYSYFGIAPDYSLEKCVKYAIIKAYEDATAQGAYNTLFSTKGANKEKIDEINSLKKKSEAAKNSSAKIIFKNIDELFRSDNENYNVWHNMVCTEVVTEYENVKNDAGAFFAYGNAQKWINMTVKYICVLDALLPDKVSDYHCYIEKHFNEFHVPVDSYIIEAIWGNEDIELPAKADINRKNEKYDTSKVEPWSKWNVIDNQKEKRYDPYDAFQKTLAENMRFKSWTETNNIESPLEWENTTWIEQAEKRKKQDKENRFNSFFKEEQNE